MPDASKNVAIGVLITIALVLIVWVLLFLHPSFGDAGKKFHVRFDDIEKVGIGTRVTYAGKAVGDVTRITFLSEEERINKKRPGTIYTFDIEVAIDSHVNVFTTDEITIGTSGLMGERFIAIIPQTILPTVSKPVEADTIFYANRAASAESAFEKITQLATKAEETVETLAGLVRENREEIQTTLQSINSASSQLNTLVTNTNNQNLVGQIAKATSQLDRTLASAEATLNKVATDKLVDTLSRTASNLESITASINRPEELKTLLKSANSVCISLEETSRRLSNSWPKVEEAINDFSSAALSAKDASLGAKQAIGTFQLVASDVASGKGSIGKLLVSDDFYFKTVAIMNKIDTAMNDVNHYGMLFHLDKGWQRDRRKSAEELARLQNPKQFKGFLSQEMAKITSSVSLLGMALEKAETAADTEKPLTAQGEFVRTFNDLLAQVQDLSSTLKAYNVAIADREAKELTADNEKP